MSDFIVRVARDSSEAILDPTNGTSSFITTFQSSDSYQDYKTRQSTVESISHSNTNRTSANHDAVIAADSHLDEGQTCRTTS
jgi:hypothetical protein